VVLDPDPQAIPPQQWLGLAQHLLPVSAQTPASSSGR
jgi:hypothetical protein